ncbi:MULTISPECIES: membrane dipeptidase [unclassified Paenibacillus]|uniref:dipeptidase n=1 Tax=unclassified Paenibacillus TaxID=185978 RepID=UPI001AE440F2|nr:MULTISPECIES: membrane dipeptidase [unclassified Paenibacillus]MBP1154980.1 membrane dipeptidase [Paenibacillus sp. PvP091]MBP1169636.1 membrane dipeptidase [Paenibacillus sp. PvR098]MBP2440664.1 membrane dipeptidase [Paenibacillus sp. PvP052]
MEEIVQKIHKEHVIIDAHRDCYEQIHHRNYGHKTPLHEFMIPRLETGGVDMVIYAIGGDTIAHSNGTDRPLRATIENIDGYYQEAEMADSKIKTVFSGSDLPADGPNGKMHYLLHIEGGMPLEGQISSLRMFYRLGVRSFAPTWNVRNELGEGVRERHNGAGLTKFGIEVMKEAQRLGMLIDVSHLSGPGVDDILDIAEQPVVATHSNSAVLFNHPRNLTDERITRIAQTGGVVGMHFAPAYIHPEVNSVERLVDHIDHMVDMVGIEHVGIGPDFVKSDGPRSPREALYGGVHSRFIEDLAEIDELPTLTRSLLRRNYTEQDIVKIYGGNFLRVLKQVLDK